MKLKVSIKKKNLYPHYWKDAVIEKFGTRSINAQTWLDLFEKECLRLEVPQDRSWEAIRLFLEGAAIEWYQSTHIIFKDASWERWRSSFLEAFAQKGWSDARSAFSYRFIPGSLSEYALKKLNLLFSSNSRMDEDTKIAPVSYTHLTLPTIYSV